MSAGEPATATLVILTDYWSVHRGNRIPVEIVVNLALAKTIRRLAARPESETWPKMAERTEIWFGGYGPDQSETVLVTETLGEILEAAGEAS